MTGRTRANTPTEQNKEDNGLILYRLKVVEDAVKEVSAKLDRQEVIKPSDLRNIQETIVTRFLDMSTNLQKQIDEVKDDIEKKVEDVKKQKADKQELSDFKKLVFGVFAFGQSIVLMVLGYLITTR